MTFYDIETGPLGEALVRAVGLAARRPPACDKIFGIGRQIGVDWDCAANCHHSNMPVVAAIGAMIDPAAAEIALGPKCRLVSACGRVSGFDDIQDSILLAAAGIPASHGCNPDRFTRALLGLIEAEHLEEYFEIESRAYAGDHYGIRPHGYAQAVRAGSGPADIECTKAAAAARSLEKDRRIPLVLILSLYNEYASRDVFKGRGWAFHGVQLGCWLRGRFQKKTQSARHALTALGSYPGW